MLSLLHPTSLYHFGGPLLSLSLSLYSSCYYQSMVASVNSALFYIRCSTLLYTLKATFFHPPPFLSTQSLSFCSFLSARFFLFLFTSPHPRACVSFSFEWTFLFSPHPFSVCNISVTFASCSFIGQCSCSLSLLPWAMACYYFMRLHLFFAWKGKVSYVLCSVLFYVIRFFLFLPSTLQLTSHPSLSRVLFLFPFPSLSLALSHE